MTSEAQIQQSPDSVLLLYMYIKSSNHRNRVYRNQMLHITKEKSSHSFRGLLQSRKKLLYVTKPVNQIIWCINSTSVIWAFCSPLRVRGLSAHRRSRADRPPCCPGPDWMKEVAKSICPASAVCPVSVSTVCHLRCLLAVGILMDKTFDQINRGGWIRILSFFFLIHSN